MFIKIKHIVLFSLLVCAFIINAQTNNSFSNYFEEIYRFNKDKSLEKKNMSSHYTFYSISNFKGNDFIKVAYNFNYDSLFLLNYNNEHIINANFDIYNDPLIKTNLLTIDTNKILYLSLNDAKDEILYSFISMENNELKIHDKNKNLSIKLPSATFNSWINFTRNKDGNIVLVVRTIDDFLLTYLIEYNKTPTFVNSINLNIYEKRIDSLDFNPLLNKMNTSGQKFDSAQRDAVLPGTVIPARTHRGMQVHRGTFGRFVPDS